MAWDPGTLGVPPGLSKRCTSSFGVTETLAAQIGGSFDMSGVTVTEEQGRDLVND